MATPALHQPASVALAGTWKLAPGRAVTLQPAQQGILRVAHGCLWATFDGPHPLTPHESGDHFMEVGETVRVAAGERLVIEPWARGGAAYFTWEPVAAAARVSAVSFAEVLQPLRELRAAAVLAVRAAARVVVVLLRAAGSVAFPPRAVAPRRAFNAHCEV